MRQRLLIRLKVYGRQRHRRLSTGGQCIALSTPNGVGNWFHRTWMDAEDHLNDFNFIKLHWTVHPDREQDWRDEQDTLIRAFVSGSRM